MQRTLTVLIVGLALSVTFAADRAPTDQAFSGTYDWRDGGSDELTADFRPTKDGGWKVKFDFRWGGDRKTWKGSATGSLEDGGKISGTSEWSGRNWVFEGTIVDGVLRGSHTEIRKNGSRYDTGTFELRSGDR